MVTGHSFRGGPCYFRRLTASLAGRKLPVTRRLVRDDDSPQELRFDLLDDRVDPLLDVHCGDVTGELAPCEHQPHVDATIGRHEVLTERLQLVECGLFEPGVLHVSLDLVRQPSGIEEPVDARREQDQATDDHRGDKRNEGGDVHEVPRLPCRYRF